MAGLESSVGSGEESLRRSDFEAAAVQCALCPMPVPQRVLTQGLLGGGKSASLEGPGFVLSLIHSMNVY